MGKLVSLSQKNLLLKSDILKDYPKLKTFLEKTPNMEESEINTLDVELKELFKNKIFNAIINKAPQEWEVDKSENLEIKDIEDIKNCEICNTKIENIYCIKNRMNNNRLIVGSTCVEKFGILDKKKLDEMLKERKEIKRRAEINNHIKGLSKKFTELELFIEKSPIIIKNAVISKFTSLKDEMMSLYNKYIKSNLIQLEKDNTINRINEILPQIELEKETIKKYIDTNKDNKLVVTKEMFKSVNPIDVKREDLKIDGFVSDKNIFRIKDIKFIEAMINTFNEHLINHDMKIIGIKEISRNVYYEIDIGNKGFAIVDYKFHEFAFNYGSLVFGQKPLEDISVNNIFRNSKIRNEKTIKTIIDCIVDILEKRNFELEDVVVDFNEIIIKNCRSKKYIILNLKETVEQFKELAISDSKESKKFEKDVIDYVIRCKNTKNEEDMNIYRSQINI